jgi:hypothetical protein
MTTATALAEKTHAFERAGLGKAPFRCVGVETKKGPITLPCGTQVGAPGQPMGSCDFCGNGIADCYQILSADGRRFEVGCDCVRKTGDAGLRRATNDHERAKRYAKTAAATDEKLAILDALLAHGDVQNALAAMPHPFDYRAAAGETRLTWATWMRRNAGNSGRLGVLQFIKVEIVAPAIARACGVVS